MIHSLPNEEDSEEIDHQTVNACSCEHVNAKSVFIKGRIPRLISLRIIKI
jgi:hypothetical protein